MYICRLFSVNLIPRYLDMDPRSLISQSLSIALRSQSVSAFFAEAIRISSTYTMLSVVRSPAVTVRGIS